MKQILIFAALIGGFFVYYYAFRNPDPSPGPSKATEIVDRAIQVHGGKNLNKVDIQFRFRKREYSIKRFEDRFQYGRTYVDKEGNQVRDTLDNSSFKRWVNGEQLALSSKDSLKYANSLNSVVYFVQLPYPLNDPAVHKEWIGQVAIGDDTYDKIKVTFDQQGGGTDFEDTYIYWFNTQSGQLDFLAYDFHIDGGGIRFREGFNKRKINGIYFLDYINYKADPQFSKVQTTDEDFVSQKLEKLSEILTEDIQVTPLSEPGF